MEAGDASQADRLPYPPLELMDRVLRLPDEEREAQLAFDEAGRNSKSELLRLLPAGTDLDGKRLLDFGCGAGRTLRHFVPEAEAGEVWGADVDGSSVDWLRDSLCPPFNVVRCDVDPPLPFESSTFDFAWAISVFTHLSGNSAEWLLELHRVLRPGGLLMASYMGEWNSERIAGEPWDEDRIGMNVLRHDWPWSVGGPMVLMSNWWVAEHWGRAFEIVAASPWFYNQSWLMLRRKDVSITAEGLLAPSDDPREYAALRHNVTQLQREIEQLRESNKEQIEGVRLGYEGSLSWRLGNPLRRLRSRGG